VVALVATSVLGGPPAAIARPTVSLKILEFNVEYGGFHVSWDSTLEVIRRADADVVAIEEGYGRVVAMARALDYPYVSRRYQVMSRFPILDVAISQGRAPLIEVAPERVVALENVHLPSNPYGPFRAKRGEPRSTILQRERDLRLPAIRPYLATARTLLAAGIPVFLAGDFNSPSWRDWTPAMVGVRPQIRYAVRWPVSVAVERAGFVDSFRAVHPDPASDPGLTWPAARPDVPGWDPGKTAPADRIDLIYAAGAASATSSEIIGERDAPGVSITVDPWPSDHRAMLSTFAVRPAPAPVLIGVRDPLVTVGRDVDAEFHLDAVGGRISLVPAGGDPGTDELDAYELTDATDGVVTFQTDGLGPGAYELVLMDADGNERGRAAFWVEAADAGPAISTGSPTYAVGDPIDVHWTDAPGNRWDWIGIYRRHRDPRVRYYLLWTYTGATVEGSTTIDASAHGPWPLPPGRYSVYLLQDDGYKKLAGADFEVTG
jgi:endonuclease/exonuclease/phosphatase family metal-dependent hydrolase